MTCFFPFFRIFIFFHFLFFVFKNFYSTFCSDLLFRFTSDPNVHAFITVLVTVWFSWFSGDFRFLLAATLVSLSHNKPLIRNVSVRNSKHIWNISKFLLNKTHFYKHLKNILDSNRSKIPNWSQAGRGEQEWIEYETMQKQMIVLCCIRVCFMAKSSIQKKNKKKSWKNWK